MTQPISLYVHWPFCVAKCPYCDFNSHAAGDVDQAPWRDGLISELQHWAQVLGPKRVETIFFGGGTPSLMDPTTVGSVLENVDRTWGLSSNAEVTLEANPSSVEVERFLDYKAAGVNRVSVGVQALDDKSLTQLGRVHGVDEAKAAISAAQRVFDRFTFDLIYARPGQSMTDWKRELAEGLAMAGDHISLYQLTIEPGTAYFRDGVEAASEDLGVEMYEVTQSMTTNAGLPAYEISNHARPGQESRHNLVYWQGGEYAGIGPGAHSRVKIGGAWHAAHQIATPERWLQAIETTGHASAKQTRLSPQERAEERVMTALRLTKGLDAESLEDVQGVINGEALADLIASGDLIHDDHGLRTTESGRLRLNGVVQHLLI